MGAIFLNVIAVGGDLVQRITVGGNALNNIAFRGGVLLLNDLILWFVRSLFCLRWIIELP